MVLRGLLPILRWYNRSKEVLHARNQSFVKTMLARINGNRKHENEPTNNTIKPYPDQFLHNSLVCNDDFLGQRG